MTCQLWNVYSTKFVPKREYTMQVEVGSGESTTVQVVSGKSVARVRVTNSEVPSSE